MPLSGRSLIGVAVLLGLGVGPALADICPNQYSCEAEAQRYLKEYKDPANPDREQSLRSFKETIRLLTKYQTLNQDMASKYSKTAADPNSEADDSTRALLKKDSFRATAQSGQIANFVGKISADMTQAQKDVAAGVTTEQKAVDGQNQLPVMPDPAKLEDAKNEEKKLDDNPNPVPDDAKKVAEKYVGAGSADDGKRVLDDFTEKEPVTGPQAAPVGDAYGEVGKTYLEQGKNDQASKSLDKAVALSPKNPDNFARRAVLRTLQGRAADAKSDARQALALDPKNETALRLLGHEESLSLAQNSIGARKLSFETPAEASGLPGQPSAPQRSLTPAQAARAAANLGTPALASVQLAANAGFSAPALLQAAVSDLRRGDFMSALVKVTAAIDQNRKNPAGWALRAQIDNQLKNYKGAVKDAEEALKLEPENAAALRARAYAELQLGDVQQALADVEAAIKLEPDNGVGYLYRAMIEEKLGRNTEALRDYDKADDLDPSLAPLTADAFRRLGPPSAADKGGAAPRAALPAPVWYLRGGATALAAALIVLGLAGATAGKKLTTTAKRLLSSRGAGGSSDDETPLAPVGPGTLLGGNYLVSGELGRGGMGVVYEAIDQALQRRVAVKQLQRDERPTEADLDRLLKEARLVASLKHPSIAEIYNVIMEGDLYLVFEFVDGRPLDAVLGDSGRLDAARTRRLLSEVCSGLTYAHGRGIIHRDLKPSNIMIAKDGAAKIMDFGIAHQASAAATAMTQTAACGTPPYMAPEQGLGSVSKASDLYALGVMTYELVTGKLPFEGPDFLETKLRRQFLAPSKRDPSLRPELDAFFARALDPDPTRRHENTEAYLRAFLAASGAA